MRQLLFGILISTLGITSAFGHPLDPVCTDVKLLPKDLVSAGTHGYEYVPVHMPIRALHGVKLPESSKRVTPTYRLGIEMSPQKARADLNLWTRGILTCVQTGWSFDDTRLNRVETVFYTLIIAPPGADYPEYAQSWLLLPSHIVAEKPPVAETRLNNGVVMTGRWMRGGMGSSIMLTLPSGR